MDKENQAVNTENLENQENTVEETQGAPEVKIRRKLKIQSPITFVSVPKKVKEAEKPAEETVDGETKPTGMSKLKKVGRVAAGTGLFIGTALVAVGSYLKGKEQGQIEAACECENASDAQETTEPDPAGINTESPDD